MQQGIRRALIVGSVFGALQVRALAQSDDVERANSLYERLESRATTRARLLERLFPSELKSGEWHVLGTFDYAGHGRNDLARPHPPEAGLVALRANGASPDFTRTFAGKLGSRAEWRSIGVGIDRRVELRLHESSRMDDLAVVYLHGTIEAAAAGPAEVEVGSDDGLKLWCNGRLLVDKDVPRSLEPPFDRVILPLEAGTNHLVAKVANGHGDFAFELDARRPLPEELDTWIEWRLDRDFPRNRERLYWRTLAVRAPPGAPLEVGGLDFLPDGRPVVATRRGDVFVVDHAFDEPPSRASFELFASGLHEPLGAAVRVEEGRAVVYCVQRPELTRLVDRDGDGVADLYDTFSDDYGVSGNYHEFAFGPKFDREGNAWITLNVGFCGSLGKSEVPWRGWAVEVTPRRKLVPVCAGCRSPDGIGVDRDGAVYYVDNQGDWVATNVLKRLAPGDFLGHPAGLRWRDDLAKDEHGAPLQPLPKPSPAVVWFPYEKVGQSICDVTLESTGGRFGPFAGQLLVGELTRARVVRVFLEDVDGQRQGACFPLLEGFESGVHRLAFAPDGSLFVGETDRGWGSIGRKRAGLERVIWSGRTPCELARMRIEPDGFRLEFTRPIDEASARDPASYKLTSYTYEWHATYGCPELDPQPHVIAQVDFVDATTVRLHVDRLRAGYVHELHMDGLRSGACDDAIEPVGSPLLHSVAYYTVQRIPSADQ